MKDYFYAEGEGVPMEVLQNQKYRDILSIRLYYDWHTYVFDKGYRHPLTDAVVQGRADGGVRTHDAAKFAGIPISQEAGQERVFPAESWHDQGSQTRKATRERGFERRNHLAYLEDAVCTISSAISSSFT